MRSPAKLKTNSDRKDRHMESSSVTSFQKVSMQVSSPVVGTRLETRSGNVIVDTVFSDGIVCLIDGKKKRDLRKWLVLQYGMTPREYRRLYNLPGDYPMSIEPSLPTPSAAKIVAFSKPRLIATPSVA
jgi:predicted transcriptional regulator